MKELQKVDAQTERRWFQLKSEALAGRVHIPPTLLEVVLHVYKLQLDARESARPVLPPESGLTPVDQRRLGAPILPRERFPYDPEQAAQLFGELSEWLGRRQDSLGEAARVIARELDQAGLKQALHLVVTDGPDLECLLERFVGLTPDAPMTLRFLLTSAVTPSVEAAAEGLRVHHDPATVWPHGHCPVCGSAPLMARLLDKEGYRVLTCSFCRTDYRAKRIQCPFCLEEDQSKLTFLFAKEEPGFRIDVCASCKGYLKTADFRELDRVCLPLLDDLDSISLDMVANREGYARPTLSGWGF